MTRVKRGLQVKKRHKKLLKATRGYKLGRSKLFKQAKQAWLRAGQHAYRDRRAKKRDFRRLWIVQLNAAVRSHHLNYRDFIHGLDKLELKLNRKVLAELALKNPEEFAKIVGKVKVALVKS